MVWFDLFYFIISFLIIFPTQDSLTREVQNVCEHLNDVHATTAPAVKQINCNDLNVNLITFCLNAFRMALLLIKMVCGIYYIWMTTFPKKKGYDLLY